MPRSWRNLFQRSEGLVRAVEMEAPADADALATTIGAIAAYQLVAIRQRIAAVTIREAPEARE